jgi:hypothetical protein
MNLPPHVVAWSWRGRGVVEQLSSSLAQGLQLLWFSI